MSAVAKRLWMKMPLGTEIGLEPGDIVLDGDPATLHKNGHNSPQFSAHVLWPIGCMDHDATSISTEEGLSPGHIVLDGDPPTPFPPKRRSKAPIFGPCLLRQNG